MSLNSTPNSSRVHIGIFGKRNAGKSSLINVLSNQNIAIVSDVKGTTTDPVFRPIEILPIGPSVLIDTAGIDDEGNLGELRKSKTIEILNKTDVAILVINSKDVLSKYDYELIEKFKAKKIPYIIALNKIDEFKPTEKHIENLKLNLKATVIAISSKKSKNIEELKNEIIKIMPQGEKNILVSDLFDKNDIAVLVTPIDKSAPKGRLILPQQQVIRDCLDNDVMTLVTKENTLNDAINNLSRKPKLVITDSQAFEYVDSILPRDIPLTSFSILFARQKGDLKLLVEGTKSIENLKDGDTVLISEGCTHHVQDDDIGRVKIPNMLLKKTNKKLNFEFSSGVTFTKNIDKYSLIVHCGACMMNRKEMLSRIEFATKNDVPIVNYGVLIAYAKGILKRALEPFKGVFENEQQG